MTEQQNQGTGETIDLRDEAASATWARKLDVTQQQLRDAVDQVGPRASDVELHLKGVRSTTNDDRVEQAPSGDKPR